MMGRSRLPVAPDERTERRRDTYRRSKARRYERLRHRRGECIWTVAGVPCPLAEIDRRRR
jgi:hypothetical protein